MCANNYEPGTVFPSFPKKIVEKYALPNGMTWEDDSDDTVYMFAEDGCEDWDELAGILQQMLIEWNGMDNNAPKYAYIKACYYCDKMRQDEFGGFAIFITRKEKFWAGTDQFIIGKISDMDKGEFE